MIIIWSNCDWFINNYIWQKNCYNTFEYIKVFIFGIMHFYCITNIVLLKAKFISMIIQVEDTNIYGQIWIINKKHMLYYYNCTSLKP